MEEYTKYYVTYYNSRKDPCYRLELGGLSEEELELFKEKTTILDEAPHFVLESEGELPLDTRGMRFDHKTLICNYFRDATSFPDRDSIVKLKAFEVAAGRILEVRPYFLNPADELRPSDESKGQWVPLHEAARRRDVKAKTLGDYRTQGESSPDKLYGKDVMGFYWKKSRPNSQSEYFFPYENS